MKVCVIGSGGREHALADVLGRYAEVVVTPGNPGIPGSVADQRQVGLGHGNLGAMLLDEKTTCFAFLAGHESFAAAEGV